MTAHRQDAFQDRTRKTLRRALTELRSKDQVEMDKLFMGFLDEGYQQARKKVQAWLKREGG